MIDPQLLAAGWNIIENSFIHCAVICPGCIIRGGMRGKSNEFMAFLLNEDIEDGVNNYRIKKQ